MGHPPIANGAVAVHGDRITWVGAAGDAPTGVVVDLGDAAVMPGLVNAHSHLELTPMRHLLEGLDFAEWIRTLTYLRRTSLADPVDVETGASAKPTDQAVLLPLAALCAPPGASQETGGAVPRRR